MANATAPEPTKAPSRQPRPDSAWVRYHPWMEGAMGNVASWSVHLLILGLVLLISWGAFGFIKHNPKLPVEPVQLAPAGGGDKNVARIGHGEEGPPQEAVNKGAKPNDSSEERPPLTPIERENIRKLFPPSVEERYIQHPTPSMERILALEEAGEKIHPGVDPTKGNEGPGKDGGVSGGKDGGPGPGNGQVVNERVKRMLRWSMKFNTQNGGDYLHQLDALGAILAVSAGPDAQFKVIRDLSKRPPPLIDEDLSKIQRIWWIDDNPKSVEGLMAAMGLPLRPSRVVAFIPPELEEELAKKELEYKGFKEDQIYETKFEVYSVGGPKRYGVRVMDQKAK